MPYGGKDEFSEDWGRYAEGETVKELSAALERLVIARRGAHPGSEVGNAAVPDVAPIEAIETATTLFTETVTPPPEPVRFEDVPAARLEALRLAALQHDPPVAYGAPVPEADASAGEGETELIVQDTPALPVIVRTIRPRDDAGDAATFEMLVEPIAVELGSAFARVVDEFGQQSTIRLDHPEEFPHWRSRLGVEVSEGVHGYVSGSRVVKLHDDNIQTVADRIGTGGRVRVAVSL
jgi:hypothetical protein